MLNEIVASNQASLNDEDGDTPDWIELYNTSTSPIDLQGYGLSDDIGDPYKWTFETGQIAGSSHAIIFASDKDRQSLNISWSLMYDEGDLWRYFVGTSNPPYNWYALDFNESQWLEDPSGFGYGDNDDNTVIPTTMSVYMRNTFSIDDTSSTPGILFHIDYDDGYIAYLNGVEFSRANMGAPGSAVNNNTPAASYTEPSLPGGIDLPYTLIPRELFQEGDNVIAVEVHNHSTSSSDLTAIPFLSVGELGGSGLLPEFLITPDQSQFHTNFKISSDGELVMLTSPDGGSLDSIRTPQLPPDISWGRDPDASGDLYYFNPPTPGETNVGGFTILAEPPTLSPEPGFYNVGIALSMGTVPAGRIYKYTLDGTKPNLGSATYSAPLSITQTTVIRVMTCEPDGTNPTQSSFSYFLNEDPNLPVLSLIFEPGAFFDNDSGMYVMGSNASPSFPHFGANFWEDWERQVHLEYFEDGDDLSYSASAGAKIFGGWSRGNPQRSISLFARGRYGTSKFDFTFFPDIDLDKFEAIVLRNSGNDWNMSGYRDGFMTGLVSERDIDKQAFQPVEVYFNGDYWGVYNLREKVNEHFVASHHDLDTDDIDLLAIDGSEVVHGENNHYVDLIDYVNSHALTSDLNFEYIEERVDIDNFIDYQLAQIYYDNQDWPGNNIKFWRSRLPGGKWRWILYDTDFGFSIWSNNNYMRNTLEFATDPNGPAWPNPPWSTLLLRKFLTNPGFRQNFILTACDLLNQPFEYGEVEAALILHQQWLLPALPDHISRWNHINITNWYNEGTIMNIFALNRPYYMRNHFRNKFNLGADSDLQVNVEPADGGLVRVHSITPESYPWSGTYFSTVPLDVRAIALPGYQFSHWENRLVDNVDLTISMLSDVELTAVFVPISPEDGALVINEINYNSLNDYDSKDWVELFNGTLESVDLEGWSISDDSDDNLFVLPDLSLQPGAYLIVSSDTLAFRSIHGGSSRIVGDLDFNFSNGGELIRLFNSDEILIDSVRYDDEDPWPIEPDGEGPTLELIHPTLDNGLRSSWAVSDNLGTPGMQNSRFVNPSTITEHHRPADFRLGMAFPNPFNARVSIPYTVPEIGAFQIDVFDLRGRLIRSERIISSGSSTGTYFWDGNNEYGMASSSGMYVVRLSQNELMSSLKIALLR
jgi:hypothetical protein